MAQAGFTWECSCGHVELSEIQPEECLKCGNIGEFMQMPADILEEREKDLAEDFEDEVLSLKKPSAKIAKSAKTSKTTKKSKSSKTKSKRSKK